MSKENYQKRRKKGKPVGAIESAYVIPPSMIRNLASDEVISIWPRSDDNVNVQQLQRPLFEILEAFLTPEYVARLASLLENHNDPQVALQNLWSLSPSIHRAFREGRIALHDKFARMAEIGYPIEESSLEKHYNHVGRNYTLHAGQC